MSASITAVVLLAALMHAVWNALVKSSSDRLLELTALNLAAGVSAACALPFVGFPAGESFPFLGVTVIFHCGYYAFLLHSYARGGLSLAYPIARGASPVLVAMLSIVLVDEPLNATQWLGVLLVAASIASLAFAGGLRSMHSHAVLYSLATSVMIAGYTITDGSGARVSGGRPVAYILCLFVLNALPLLIVMPFLRPGAGWRGLGRHLTTGGLGGILSIGAYGLAIWAMTRAPIALVSSIRETSVVLATVIGATFLREPFGRARVLASIGVALGIVVLRLAS